MVDGGREPWLVIVSHRSSLVWSELYTKDKNIGLTKKPLLEHNWVERAKKKQLENQWVERAKKKSVVQ